jgi:hypothetical protein
MVLGHWNSVKGQKGIIKTGGIIPDMRLPETKLNIPMRSEKVQQLSIILKLRIKIIVFNINAIIYVKFINKRNKKHYIII